jgi:hypothetical protein
MRNLTGHTATIDEVVGRTLQLWNPDNPIHSNAQPGEVLSLLNLDLEGVEASLEYALPAPNGAQLQQLKAQRDQVKEYIDTGELIQQQIQSELENDRQGKPQTLLIPVIQVNHGDIYESEDVRLTTSSAYDWVYDTFDGLEIPEWRTPKRTRPQQAGTSETEATFTELEKSKLEVMIALLVEVMAEDRGGRYMENNHPNYTLIAQRARDMYESAHMDMSGLSADKMRRRFSDAMRTKANHMPRQN